MDKRYRISLGIATILHVLGLFLLQLPKIMAQRGAAALKWTSVEYTEEEKKKMEEKKKEKEKEEEKLLTPKTPTVSIADKFKMMFKEMEKIDDKDLRKFAQIANPLKIEKIDAKIALDRIDKLASQIAIDAEALEGIDLEAAKGDIEVLRIGAGKSTAEILAEEKIVLPEAALAKAKVGLWTTPGAAVSGEGGGFGSQIELEKSKAEDLLKEQQALKEAFKVAKKVEIPSEKTGGPKTEVEIAGELKDRQILNMPLPKFPEWAEKRGIGAYIRLQVKVGPDGVVIGTPITLQTTGYPEWDNMVINWIKKNWRWASSSGVTPGGIGIRFIIE